jgi:hypothetical protein
MAIQEEILRLKFETQGDERYAALVAMVEKMAGRLDILQNELQQTRTSFDQVTAAEVKTEAQTVKTTAAMARASKEVGTSRYGGLNGALLSASYGMQDFATNTGSVESKLLGMTNNLSPLLLSLGVSGGLTAVLGLASVGMAMFGGKLASMVEPGGEVVDVLEEMKARLEELGTKKYEMKVDASAATNAIGTLTAMQSAIQAARAEGGTPELSQLSAARVNKAIDEFGGFDEKTGRTGQTNIMATTVGIMRGNDREFQAADSEFNRQQQEVDRIRAALTDPANADQETRNALRLQLKDAQSSRDAIGARAKARGAKIQTEADLMVGGALKGTPGKTGQFLGFMEQNRDRFLQSGVDPQIFPELRASLPDAIRQQEAQGQAARFRAEAEARAEGGQKKGEEIRKAEEAARKRSEAEQRRKDDLQTRAEAQTAGRVGAVMEAGMVTPLETQLSQGQDPFALTQGLAQELQAQGVSQKASIEQAASMVEKAIQNVLISNAQKDAAVVDVLNKISTSMNIQANQAQRTRAQIFSQQSGTMGNFRGRGR